MDERRKGGWRAPVFIGCGMLLALGACVAALVALNWRSVSTFYQQAVTTFADLRSVQTALQAKYHTQDVSVQVKRVGDISGSILSINLINPPFLKDPAAAGPSGKAKALEVATAARDALLPQREYDHYEIAFTQRWGVGINVSSGQSFSFRASELPPRNPR